MTASVLSPCLDLPRGSVADARSMRPPLSFVSPCAPRPFRFVKRAAVVRSFRQFGGNFSSGGRFLPSWCPQVRFLRLFGRKDSRGRSNSYPFQPRTACSGSDSSTRAEVGSIPEDCSADDTRADAPAPGSAFYLGTAGFFALLALATTAIIDKSVPSASMDSHYIMLCLVGLFAAAHSGLASLRPRAVQIVGERVYRVFFALVSIPGAVATISYFIAHRYDGMQFWSLQGVPGVREAVWVATFVSFLLLYPATFNLAEVAAIQKPGFRIYEKGVMRITRHPQLWGQVIWCIAHTAWMGTSLTFIASLGLVAHHSFAVWNGDRRLKNQFGAEWEAYAARTSVLPFRAVLDGRQKIRVEELTVKAYVGVILFIFGAYASHPAMLRAVGSLHL